MDAVNLRRNTGSTAALIGALAVLVAALVLYLAGVREAPIWGVGAASVILVLAMLLLRTERRARQARIAGFADSAAAAESLRNSRGLVLSQQADILQFLQQAAAQWGDLGAVLPEVTALTAKVMRAERVSLWHYNADETKFVCADLYENSGDVHRSGMERDPADLPVGMRALDQRPVSNASPSFADEGQYFVDDRVAFAPTAMYLPILKSARTIGMLEIVRENEAGSHAVQWASEERMFGMMISSLVMLLMEQDAHRRSQAALEEREYQLRVIADSVPALIAYVDANECVRFHNRAYAEWFGRAQTSAVGQSLQDVLGTGIYRSVRKKLRRALAGNEVSFQRSRRTRDGAQRTDLVKCVPHLAADGQVLGFHALVIDISEQKHHEQEIRDALTRAENAARTRDEFLATVSHELRTPLNAIIGFNTLMLEKPCAPEERARYLGFARDAGKDLLLQVNDLLDMAKIEAGSIQLESVAFDLALLIESAVDTVRSEAQRRGLELRTSIAAELSQWVCGDPARLRQILLNLLSNAVKFTERGAVAVNAGLDRHHRLEIKVVDTGVGIAPEKLERIFDKFFQTDPSVTRRYGGTGLGLAICKSLAGLMGGALSVESMPGRGCTFSVALPYEPTLAPTAAAFPERKARRGRVLVVEDQEANAILAKALVEHLGHEVELAGNGYEAIERLTQRSFDLVLMDLAMPMMGGLEATRRIRDLANPMRNVIIVAVSASAYATDIERCKAAGMNDHIAKPIELEALTKMFERWLVADGEASAAAVSSTPNGVGGVRLDKLVATIGLRSVLNVAAAFREVLPARLRLFRTLPLEKPAIKVEAHNLAGISATLGFDELERIAREVVDRCKRSEAIDELMPELIARCESAEQTLQALAHGAQHP